MSAVWPSVLADTRNGVALMHGRKRFGPELIVADPEVAGPPVVVLTGGFYKVLARRAHTAERSNLKSPPGSCGPEKRDWISYFRLSQDSSRKQEVIAPIAVRVVIPADDPVEAISVDHGDGRLDDADVVYSAALNGRIEEQQIPSPKRCENRDAEQGLGRCVMGERNADLRVGGLGQSGAIVNVWSDRSGCEFVRFADLPRCEVNGIFSLADSSKGQGETGCQQPSLQP